MAVNTTSADARKQKEKLIQAMLSGSLALITRRMQRHVEFSKLSKSEACIDRAMAVNVGTASDLGSAEGLHMIGACFAYGVGHERNHRIAEIYLTEAINAGECQARLTLARSFLLFGDAVQARSLLETCVADSIAGASEMLSSILLSDTEVESHRRAVKLLRRASQSDSEIACLMLSRCYETGKGTKKSATMSRKLLDKCQTILLNRII